MTSLAPPPTRLKDALEGAGKLVTLAGVFLLPLSVVYDYSFLLALDISFGEVSTSLADHVRSAIVWLPLVVPAGIAGAVYLKMEGDVATGLLGMSSDTYKAFDQWWMRVAVVALIISSYLFDGGLIWAYLGSMFVWWKAAPRLLPGGMGRIVTPFVHKVIVFLPVLFMAVGLLGYANAAAIARATAPEWAVVLVNNHIQEIRNYSGLRRFGEATVAIAPGGQVHILRSAALLEIGTISDTFITPVPACRWLGLTCDKHAQATPAGARERAAKAASAPLAP